MTGKDTPALIKVSEAARMTGIPVSTLRKSFMAERPRNIPAPPPHKRTGRAVYIIAKELDAWLDNLGIEPRKRGRPTVAQRNSAGSADRKSTSLNSSH